MHLLLALHISLVLLTTVGYISVFQCIANTLTRFFFGGGYI